MLDVYFAARFLQLRDGLPDGEDRSTRATLDALRGAGSVGEEDFEALREGYALLRRLDHDLRLIAGRSTRLPAAQDHPLLRDLARRAGYASAAALAEDLSARMSAVRAAYERILRQSE
jgi:glutamate-ammonia-ligase adenylyltransferase